MDEEEMQDIVIYAIRASQIGEGYEKDHFKYIVGKLMRKALRNGMSKKEQDDLKAALIDNNISPNDPEIYEMIDSFLLYVSAKDIFSCEDHLVSKYIH